MYGSLYSSVKAIVKTEGLRGLQKGLAPALSFQFVMNSIRLGPFQTASNLGWTKFDKSSKNQSPILYIFWGGTSGVLGSVIGSPLYMIKTQMQAQSVGKYAVGYQHNHNGLFDALRNTFKKHGFLGSWRGLDGMIPRAIVGSSAQLASFSICKDALVKYNVCIYYLSICYIKLLLFSDLQGISIFNCFCLSYD